MLYDSTLLWHKSTLRKELPLHSHEVMSLVGLVLVDVSLQSRCFILVIQGVCFLNVVKSQVLDNQVTVFMIC